MNRRAVTLLLGLNAALLKEKGILQLAALFSFFALLFRVFQQRVRALR